MPKRLTGSSIGMVQKVGPRLRDPASWLSLAARTSSRNLGPIFSTISVAKSHVKLATSMNKCPFVVVATAAAGTDFCAIHNNGLVRHSHAWGVFNSTISNLDFCFAFLICKLGLK